MSYHCFKNELIKAPFFPKIPTHRNWLPFLIASFLSILAPLFRSSRLYFLLLLQSFISILSLGPSPCVLEWFYVYFSFHRLGRCRIRSQIKNWPLCSFQLIFCKFVVFSKSVYYYFPAHETQWLSLGCLVKHTHFQNFLQPDLSLAIRVIFHYP